MKSSGMPSFFCQHLVKNAGMPLFPSKSWKYEHFIIFASENDDPLKGFLIFGPPKSAGAGLRRYKKSWIPLPYLACGALKKYVRATNHILMSKSRIYIFKIVCLRWAVLLISRALYSYRYKLYISKRVCLGHPVLIFLLLSYY